MVSQSFLLEEQGRVIGDKACNHPATLKGHSSPGKSKGARDQDSNEAFPPREVGCPAGTASMGQRRQVPQPVPTTARGSK